MKSFYLCYVCLEMNMQSQIGCVISITLSEFQNVFSNCLHEIVDTKGKRLSSRRESQWCRWPPKKEGKDELRRKKLFDDIQPSV